MPNISDIPHGDDRSFHDRRTFGGFYVNDEWTPVPFLTITGGARYDLTSESLYAQQQEVGAPEPDVSRRREILQPVVGRRFDHGPRRRGTRPGALNEFNVYFSGKTAFKPAAPNLTEAESAQILQPERTTSEEIGIKTRWLDRQLSFEASVFHMIFKNLVTSILGPDGNPELVNAGEERFQGTRARGRLPPGRPCRTSPSSPATRTTTRGTSTSRSSTRTKARTSADGQRLELTPRDLWNANVSYHPAEGFGGWFAVRHQNQRPFDKINEAYMPSFFEYDVGALVHVRGRAPVSFVGRNLGQQPPLRRRERDRRRAELRRAAAALPGRAGGEVLGERSSMLKVRDIRDDGPDRTVFRVAEDEAKPAAPQLERLVAVASRLLAENGLAGYFRVAGEEEVALEVASASRHFLHDGILFAALDAVNDPRQEPDAEPSLGRRTAS